jgi:hypothetical protein
MKLLKQTVIQVAVICTAVSWCTGTENADSHANVCGANLRLIDSAKEQWAMKEGKSGRDQVDVDKASAYISSQIAALECPSKGRYSVGVVDKNPICSIHGDLILREAQQSSERARVRPDEKGCTTRLATLFKAQRAWAIVEHKTTNDAVVAAEVLKYAKQGKSLLDCASGTPYTLGKASEPPICAAHPECKISSYAVQHLTRALADTKGFCRRNLRLIDSAKEQWAMANRKNGRDAINIEEASSFVSLPITDLTCPSGGEYSIGTQYDERPTCSKHGALK